eukprot:2340782-Prymnesium_polylepis.1
MDSPPVDRAVRVCAHARHAAVRLAPALDLALARVDRDEAHRTFQGPAGQAATVRSCCSLDRTRPLE